MNPLHIDPVFARRTGAGSPIVHGMHNLLWCLDSIGQQLPSPMSVSSLRVNFDAFVAINERVDIVLDQSDANRLRAEVRVRGVPALTVLIGRGDKRVATPFEKPADFIDPVNPIDPPDDQIAGLAGRVPFATPPAAAADFFPFAAAMLGGSRRVAALGAFTRLIGMVCPGMHSVFNKVSVATSDDDGADEIAFRVANASLTHRRILCAVAGGGWAGTLTSMMRHPPTAQPSIAEFAKHVVPGEFGQSVAIVVGGSRGIGEVSAKILAAGGGCPIITYASGQTDAQRVADEIRGWGGICEIMRLDVTLPIAEQVAAAKYIPNQLLYFATPMIGARRSGLFEADRMQEFLRFYVNGFYDCCCALIDKGPTTLTALYPSSTFVTDRPSGMTEYAMAKIAGEHLCHDMNGSFKSFRALAPRLPRLSTDQNPGLLKAADLPSVCEVLLPLIRSMGDSSIVRVDNERPMIAGHSGISATASGLRAPDFIDQAFARRPIRG